MSQLKPICFLLTLVSLSASAQTLTTVQVAMRDGTELATDVWLPDAPSSPLPVLLRRTPYGRTLEASGVTGALSLGYAVVSQDVRGRGGSAGSYLPFFNDAEDGFDTIAWIAEQSWSNGRVGTYSGSAEGIVQLFAAGQAPPALRCAHVLVATGDMYEALFQGGAWRQELGTNWLNGLMEPEALVTVRGHEVLDDFWDPVRLSDEEISRVSIPILQVGGFYDIFSRGTTRTHAALRRGASPGARDDQFLVFGPWTHGGVGQTTQGELGFPADSAYQAYIADFISFFAWCLQDAPRPTLPGLHYYLTEIADDGTSATGEWRDDAAWPPVTETVPLFLHADGELRRVPPNKELPASRLPVNPADPVPSLGGTNLTIAPGPFDQTPLASRPDVLTLQTATFTEPVEVIGDVTARIWAASDTTDIDVIVRLEQLTPSGRSILLVDGARRGRFVEGLDAIRPLTPGVAKSFEVDLGPLSNRIPTGHRLRVSISGTSFPRYELNPNQAVALSAGVAPIATVLTVHADPDRPSAILLPIASGKVPSGAYLPPNGVVDELPPVQPPDLETGCGCGQAPASGSAFFALVALLIAHTLRRRRHREVSSFQ